MALFISLFFGFFMNGIPSRLLHFSCPEEISRLVSRAPLFIPSTYTDTVLALQCSPAFPANIQDHHSRSEISSAKSLRIVMHQWPWPAKLNVLTPRGLI